MKNGKEEKAKVAEAKELIPALTAEMKKKKQTRAAIVKKIDDMKPRYESHLNDVKLLETLKQIESQMVVRNYKGFLG